MSISFWTSKQSRAVPWSRHHDTLVAGISENRFMNLLNSDRFSLVKRWEGDTAILHRTRRDRLYTDCWSRSEAEEEVQHSCRAHPNAAPTILDVKSNNLLLVFSSSNQNAGGALGVEVVNTSDTRIRFRMRNCDILDYYRK